MVSLTKSLTLREKVTALVTDSLTTLAERWGKLGCCAWETTETCSAMIVQRWRRGSDSELGRR